MSEKRVVLTYNGLKNLEDELQELKTVRRKDVAEKIKEARGQGDLSENAEYDSAKEEQAEIEARIATIEKMLRNVDLIDEEDLDTDKVSLGSRVKILEDGTDEEMEYYIVGSAESDPMNGKISNESPLGTAILGTKVGDSVVVSVPDGEITIKILEIAH